MSEDSSSNSSSDNDSSDSESGWEEVPPCPAPVEYKAPLEGIQITVPLPGVSNQGKKKKGVDIHALIRRELNRHTKEYQEDLHKVNLLCLLAQGLRYNEALRSETVLAAALSTLPSKQAYPPKNMDFDYMEKFIKWFRKKFVFEDYDGTTNELMIPNNLEEVLISHLQVSKVRSHNYLVCVLIVILRSLGIQARFVWSLNPASLKPASVDLLKDPDSKIAKKTEESNGTKQANTKPVSQSNGKNCKSPKPSQKLKANRASESPATATTGNSKSKNPSTSSAKKLKPEYSDSDDSDFEISKPKRKKVQVSKQMTKIKVDVKDKPMPKSKKLEQYSTSAVVNNSEKVKVRYDMWAEAYLEEEERWISVDLTNGSLLCDAELEKKATPPLDYVLAFDNQGNVKDVTRRYCSQWLTSAQKRRVDSGWWAQTIRPFQGNLTGRDNEEEEALDQQLMNKPVPTSITELKGHPLYVLRRHLLKFEAIYPPEPMPVGVTKVSNSKGEPIFSREYVKTLHSRELWMRQAKSVLIGEKPYKIVKSRPKWDKRSGQVINDVPLELFGEWQVADYEPPIAIDGKVPRNDYGNVELFKASMLPRGTVHLQAPGLNSIARKLDIDCARAVVGFEFHMNGMYPTFDGFVVCEEFKDILLDAWSQEQDEKGKREAEKRTKRVHANWAKLVKGVLIRERLMRAGHTFSAPEKLPEPKSGAKKRKT